MSFASGCDAGGRRRQWGPRAGIVRSFPAGRRAATPTLRRWRDAVPFAWRHLCQTSADNCALRMLEDHLNAKTTERACLWAALCRPVGAMSIAWSPALLVLLALLAMSIAWSPAPAAMCTQSRRAAGRAGHSFHAAQRPAGSVAVGWSASSTQSQGDTQKVTAELAGPRLVAAIHDGGQRGAMAIAARLTECVGRHIRSGRGLDHQLEL